jgi:Kef-type K+ transport system membrane component KefB
VIGEVLAGIMLGPSLLGRLAPDVGAFVLPDSITPALTLIAQIGVVLYMFVVGLELNLDRVGSRAHATVAISHASIVAPFVLGTTLALYLYPRVLDPPPCPSPVFALFIGVAMSITAFPVLARILSDRGMTHSDLGVVALTCAAVDDVTAWCLLAFVVGVAEARAESALFVVLTTLAFIAVMLLGVRPLIRRLGAGGESRSWRAFVVTLVGVALSALVTEKIGVHAIFGAFLFGAVLPHDGAVARTWTTHLKRRSPSCCCRRSSRSPGCGRASISSPRRSPGSSACSSSSWPRPASSAEPTSRRGSPAWTGGRPPGSAS